MALRRLAESKINLGLHVLRRRHDGYHDLETVFVRIPWADEVDVRPGDGITMTCSDPALPTDERNLCLRAALRLAERLSGPRGATIHLEKRVPYGSGLGGGSSDAAATLDLLLRLWDAELDSSALAELAAGVGADVAFFLGPSPAFATGRGEQLTPLLDPERGSPYVPPFSLVVLVPDVQVSTAEAYGMVTPRNANRPDLRAAVLSNDLDRWRAEIKNDFEPVVLEAFPAIRSVRQMLVDAGAGYVSLSGTGSAVFGFFEDPSAATAVTEAARFTGIRVWAGSLGPV